jgi:Protein of unknown function (DUF2628)
MRVYTVHMHRPALDPEEDIRLVKEGFSWPAFFFSFVWALWCRLWLVAAGLLTLELAVGAVLSFLNGDWWTQAALSLGTAVLIGVFANDLKRWTLFRRNYLEVAVVTGSGIDAAERRFWDQRPQLAADLVR